MFQASQEAVETFVEDVGLLWCPGTITVLDAPPTTVQFLRDFVALSRPCIIKNAIVAKQEEKAAAAAAVALSLDALVEQNPDLLLTVDVTPDGHGDCIRRVMDNVEELRIFVQPAQRTITVADFRQKLRSTQKQRSALDVHSRVFSTCTSGDGDEGKHSSSSSIADEEETAAVFYYSRQNDCLRTELASVWQDCNFPETIPWAEEAFGIGPPDAVNLWIGNSRAVSSMHKDHYENLFYVCSGEKIFSLCPPADAPFLYEREHDSGQFVIEKHENATSWKVRVEKDARRVQWIAADVTRKDDDDDDPSYLSEFPLLQYTHPIEIRVQAGEMLYLPALWFHRVTQSCETVAINYWYEMRFDSPSWCYFHLLQQVRPVCDEVEPATTS